MAETGARNGVDINAPWWRQLNRYHWLVFAIATLSWMFDCMDQQLFKIVREPAMHSLLYGRQANVADATPLTSEQTMKVQFYGRLATGMLLLGWAVGGLCFGMLSDRIGRVRTMTITISIYAGFTGLSALSTAWWDFIGYRFLMGLGVGGLFAAAVSLVAEVTPPAARPHALGLLQAFSALGNIAGSALAVVFKPQSTFLGVENWRWLFTLGVVPAILVVLIQRKVKEPESWQHARSRASEDLHRQLGAWRDLFSPAYRRHTLAGLALAIVGVIGLWGVAFFSPELIRDSLKTLSKDKQDVYVSIGLMLQDMGAFWGVYFFTVIAARFGRRPAFGVCFLAAFIATALVFQSLRQPGHVLWMLPILGFCTLSPFGGYAIYFPELYPTRLRSSGVGFCYNVGRIVTAMALFGSAYLVEFLKSLNVREPFRVGSVLIACVYFLGILVLVWAPETRGRPLPED